MELPLSTAVLPTLEYVEEVASTNQELRSRALRGKATNLSAVATTKQTAGRGRMGREWVAPPGKTFAVSVLFAPSGISVESLTWMSLIGGLAMSRAVGTLVGDRAVSLKWPNDVHIGGLKVSGLLSELVETGDGLGVVVGAGLNLTIEQDELPTTTSTSLLLEGATPGVDLALSAYLRELTALVSQFIAHSGDPIRSGILVEVRNGCATIGRRVRVELPDGKNFHGRAGTIDDHGQLVVVDDANGTEQHVAAGDVTHLRYE